MMSLLIGYGIASGIASTVVLACGVVRACRKSAGPEPACERGASRPQLQQFPA